MKLDSYPRLSPEGEAEAQKVIDAFKTKKPSQNSGVNND